MSKHTHDLVCPSCEEKLLTAHEYIVNWFTHLKRELPTIHVSWAYRNQAEQDQYFGEGKTHARFPNSPHNQCDLSGKPCSRALDLFEIDKNGMAVFDRKIYEAISQKCIQQKDEIIWGGNFKSIGDADHFQYHPLS